MKRNKLIAACAALCLSVTALSGCGNDIGTNGSLSPLSKAETEVTTAVTTVTEPVTTTQATTTTPEVTTTANTAVTIPEEDVFPTTGEWADNNIVIADRYNGDKIRALLPFYSTDSIGQWYAEVLNSYKEMVGPDVNVYNMSIPLASQFYMPPDFADVYADQADGIKNIGSALKDVKNVDLIDTMKAHLNEYIYSRTDHHWQPLGAYYAAGKFCEEAGVDFVSDLSKYEKCVKEGFCGTMYSFTYVQELMDHPDTFTYYKPQNDYTVTYYDEAFTSGTEGDLFFDWVEGVGCYSVFMGGDMKITEIKTDVDNGRCVVLIKDSYGNALVPFLVGSFSKIYVVDFRYAEITMKELFEKVGATDILFGMSISSGYTPGQIECIEGIKG
ncbi:DHHW protein [Ruminococcaceae bacterium FB2012]|nr:DHHW protein [Ruminococcaceae bacterium FB2012]